MVFNGLLSESSEQASSHGRGSAAINSMAMQKHMDADVNLQFQLLMRKPALAFIFASKYDYFGDNIQVVQKKKKERRKKKPTGRLRTLLSDTVRCPDATPFGIGCGKVQCGNAR